MSTDRNTSRRAASTRARILAAILMAAPLAVGTPAKAGLLSSSMLATVSTFATGLDNPRGLKFGPDGNLYVASRGTDSILRFDGATGAFIDEFVASGSGGLNDPHFLAFTPQQ